MSQITEGKIMQTIDTEMQKEEGVSITITESYYRKLLANAWAVERLKKHLRNCTPNEFYNRSAAILIGSLEDKMDIKDFGRENNGKHSSSRNKV